MFPHAIALPHRRILVALAAALLLAACGPSPEQMAAAEAADAQAREAKRALLEEAEQRAEAERLTALWSYTSFAVPGETAPQKAATLRNQRPEFGEESFVEPPTVQLVLRDDPRWGQSVYLIIEDGLFDCGSPCAFNLRFDGGEPLRYTGDASSTGTRPALFIEDDVGFITAIVSAKQVAIEPVSGRHAPLLFEVAGFDPMRYAAGR